MGIYSSGRRCGRGYHFISERGVRGCLGEQSQCLTAFEGHPGASSSDDSRFLRGPLRLSVAWIPSGQAPAIAARPTHHGLDLSCLTTGRVAGYWSAGGPSDGSKRRTYARRGGLVRRAFGQLTHLTSTLLDRRVLVWLPPDPPPYAASKGSMTRSRLKGMGSTRV